MRLQDRSRENGVRKSVSRSQGERDGEKSADKIGGALMNAACLLAEYTVPIAREEARYLGRLSDAHEVRCVYEPFNRR